MLLYPRCKIMKDFVSRPDNTPKNEASPRVIIGLSMNYDACADILFEEAIEQGQCKSNIEERFIKNAPGTLSAIQGCRQALEGFLDEQTLNADQIELYCGSLRQDVSSDLLHSQLNHNASCFESLANFADKKGWNFNRLLLADNLDATGRLRNPRLPSGTAMGLLAKDNAGSYKHWSGNTVNDITCPPDRTKIKMLIFQLEDIIKKYPKDKITFIFIHNNRAIISNLKAYFSAQQQHELLSKINFLNLVHFDSTPIFKTCLPQLNIEINTVMEQAKQLIKCEASFLNGKHSELGSVGFSPFSLPDIGINAEFLKELSRQMIEQEINTKAIQNTDKSKSSMQESVTHLGLFSQPRPALVYESSQGFAFSMYRIIYLFIAVLGYGLAFSSAMSLFNCKAEEHESLSFKTDTLNP